MTADSARPAVAPLAPMLARQAWCEVLRMWRTPAFTVSGLLLPVLLYAFFGLPAAGRPLTGGEATAPAGAVDGGAFMLASLAAYAVGSMMIFSFGIGLASDRAARLDQLYRASPLPPAVYLASRLLMAVLFALLVLLLLFTFATLVGGVRLSPLTWIAVISRLVLGSVPFAALGFAIGYAASPQAASGVANLIYLPLSFGSGLFVPLPALPPLVQQVAPILPTYHYGQLAWGAVGAPSEDPAVSAAWLAGYAVLFLAIAVRWYRVEEQRKFG